MLAEGVAYLIEEMRRVWGLIDGEDGRMALVGERGVVVVWGWEWEWEWE